MEGIIMSKRYALRLPTEIQKGVPPQELPPPEELDLLAEEEADEYVDEDVIISRLLVAARNGDETARKELREFLGDVD
jgi:hypothetical protein